MPSTPPDRSALPAGLLADLDAGRTDRWTVIRTPAVPDDFPLLALLRDAGFPVLKRVPTPRAHDREPPPPRRGGYTRQDHHLDAARPPVPTGRHAVEAFLGGIARSTGSNLLLTEAAGEPRALDRGGS